MFILLLALCIKILLQDIFQLIVSTFSGLKDAGGPSFGRRVVILETVAKYRSCVVMLDLECDDLVNEMFSTFFAVARYVSLLFSCRLSSYTSSHKIPLNCFLQWLICSMLYVVSLGPSAVIY